MKFAAALATLSVLAFALESGAEMATSLRGDSVRSQVIFPSILDGLSLTLQTNREKALEPSLPEVRETFRVLIV